MAARTTLFAIVALLIAARSGADTYPRQAGMDAIPDVIRLADAEPASVTRDPSSRVLPQNAEFFKR
jgi:hypothetical protein